MADRAALVTGGSSGIGLAIARALGEDGYSLTVSARRPEKLEEAVKGLVDAGLDAQAVATNVASEDELNALVAAHRDRFGRLDVLVNNAGVGIAGLVEEAQTKHLDLQIGVNLRAVYLLTRECAPMLKEAGAEHRKALIVNLASIAGKFGQAGLAAYAATKAAVVNLSQSSHGELARHGVHVTALCPAFVATPMTDWAEQAGVPKDEMMQPDDMAEAVRFLLRVGPNCIVPEIMFIRPGDEAGRLRE